jgi:hypothetical protein
MLDFLPELITAREITIALLGLFTGSCIFVIFRLGFVWFKLIWEKLKFLQEQDIFEPRMNRSHAIPASTISAWMTPGLTSSPQAFKASDAPTAAVSIFNPSLNMFLAAFSSL